MRDDATRNENAPDDAERSDRFFETEDAIELYLERIDDPEFSPEEEKAIDRYFTDIDAAVLDIGCGVGRVSSLLHERGYDVTGVDVSKPFVEHARSLFPEIEFCKMDITNVSFRSKTFDYAIFSWFGLDYILPKSERVEALREIHRILKPSGIVVFSTHNSWHPLVPRSPRDLLSCVYDVFDLYIRKKNHGRLFSRYKIERVPLGDVGVYLSNPVHQWLQFRKCGLTLLDVVGREDGFLRFFEREACFVAKK